MKISDEGLAHIRRWEGLRLEAYRDTGGVLTVGFGHTGPDVTPGLTITEAEAERLLRDDLAWAQDAVAELVTVPLSQHQFDALVSFVYNVGAENFATSTLLRKLNAGAYDAVPSQLNRWVYDDDPKTGKKVVVDGLVNRRAAEAGLWAKGSHVASRTIKAAPPPPDKPAIARETLTAAGATATGILVAVKGLEGQIALAVAIVIGVAGVAAVGLIVWQQVRKARA